jgi:hypothetical protein
MLIATAATNHDHRGCVYDDDAHTVYCPGCGLLWVAQPSTQDLYGRPQWLGYWPVGRVVPDREPFMEE